MPRAKPDAVPAGRRDCLPAPPGAGVAGCQVGEWAGWTVPRAKPDAVPAGRRDCLSAPPGAGAANGEQKRHADAEKTNAFGLWRAGGERKKLRLAGNQRQDRRKRHADAEKTNAFGLWRAGGERKNSGSQGTKGKTAEKGTMTLKRPTLIAFGEPKVKEKASGSQRTGGKTEEIIRWRIGFGTVGRRNRPFPAAADDCPAR